MSDPVSAGGTRAPLGRRLENDAAGERRHIVKLKLNDSENAFVTALARSRGLSRQAVLLSAAYSGGADAAARFDRLREELRGALRLLANAANNVNQLAKQQNSFAAGAPDAVAVTTAQIDATLASLDDARGRVEHVAAATISGGLS